ncbi:MAG: Fic family protein [Candidatus Latescibacterota bacterium]
MARQYEQTHPHLSFRVDLSAAQPQLWIALGECQSKCEHLARVPLRPDTARRLNIVYLAKGALGTTAIEGNTLSEEEVVQHIDGKLDLPPSRQYLADEIDRIIGGCNAILEKLTHHPAAPLSVETITWLNRQVLEGLAVGEDVVPGKLREHSVLVGRYRGAPAEDCEYLLERLCRWLNGPDFTAPSSDLTVVYALLKAIIAHLYVAWIHPFGDGNGRTARLLEFLILVGAGVPAVSTHLLSNHYNLTRSAYYRELDNASRTGGNLLPFLWSAVEGFRDGLRDQLKAIWAQQHDVIWRNYVHEYFREYEDTEAGVRRRRLALGLSLHPEPVPRAKLPEVSTSIAAAYAKVADRTMDRDIEFLLQHKLVIRTSEGYSANRELIHGFMTPRAPQRSDGSTT